MAEQQNKTFLKVFMSLCVIVPLVVLVYDPVIGGLLLLLGVVVMRRAMIMIADSEREAQHNPYAESRSDLGRTIFVELVDEHGVELEPAVARAKLAEAQRLAGPRDTVISVRHRAAK